MDWRVRVRYELYTVPRDSTMVVGGVLAYPGICGVDCGALVLAGLLVPHLGAILHGAPSSSIGYAFLCGALWGVALREWRGTSRRTKVLVASGLFLLVSSTIVVGYGNYVKAKELTTPVAQVQEIRTNE